MTDCPRRIQPFRTDRDAILDTAAAEYAKRVVEVGKTLFGGGIAAVRKEAVRLQQAGRADEAIGVPPERRTPSRTAGAENALVQTIELGAVLGRLQAHDCPRRRTVDPGRLDPPGP